jgi:hypothetical protein
VKKRTVVSSVFLVFVLQMFSPITAKAQSLDGAEWNKTSGLGYWTFRRGYDRGVARLHLATSLKFKSANGKELQARASDRLFLRNRVLSFARPVKNGEITDEMTLFYKDFRNTPVCWWDAAEIAELTLKGAAPSENDLVALRSEDAKDGCQ